MPLYDHKYRRQSAHRNNGAFEIYETNFKVDKAKKAPSLTKLNTKNRAALLKQKLIVYISRLQKCVLNMISTPKLAPRVNKIAPKGQKKCKRGHKCGQYKNKK